MNRKFEKDSPRDKLLRLYNEMQDYYNPVLDGYLYPQQLLDELFSVYNEYLDMINSN